MVTAAAVSSVCCGHRPDNSNNDLSCSQLRRGGSAELWALKWRNIKSDMRIAVCAACSHLMTVSVTAAATLLMPRSIIALVPYITYPQPGGRVALVLYIEFLCAAQIRCN